MNIMIPCDKWIREEIKGLKTYSTLTMSSSLKIKENGHGKLVNNHIGCYLNNANNVYYNATNVSILSEAFTGWCGLSIIPENFHKVVTLFTARRSIKCDWINDKDEYIFEEYK